MIGLIHRGVVAWRGWVDRYMKRKRVTNIKLTPTTHKQVLLERGVASGALEQMVRFCAPGAIVEFLRPGEEFWGPRRAFRCVFGVVGLLVG